MKPCIHCGSTTAQRGSEASVACFNYSECDTRRCAMQEPTRPPCPFVFLDGERCADKEGHEEYAMALGHLRPAPPTLPEMRPVLIEDPSPRRFRPGSAVGRMAIIAIAMSAGLASIEAERRPPPPPPPDPEEEARLRAKIRASSLYGRLGEQPMPRAFYTLEKDEGPSMSQLLDMGEKRLSDQRHLTAAEEKRARKARKRLGK